MSITAPLPEQPLSLADVRALVVERGRAEVAKVVGALGWVERHQVDPRSSDDVAVRDYGDGELLLAGDGAPTLSEAAVVELITTLRKADAGGRRRMDVHLDQMGTDGFVPFDGLLDYADARDLDAAVAQRAAQLAETCDEPYDVRRAMALGEICRGELALQGSGGASGESRGVTLYVHVDETQVAHVDGVDGHPVLVEQVAAWCGAADVTIKPVIDLNQAVESTGYTPSGSVAEQVRLTWPRCVFPFCTRRARRADLDHRVRWPDGPTSTTNLGPLCRTHHRMKTFSGWTYEPAATTAHGVPTALIWTSPTSGSRYLVDQ